MIAIQLAKKIYMPLFVACSLLYKADAKVISTGLDTENKARQRSVRSADSSSCYNEYATPRKGNFAVLIDKVLKTDFNDNILFKYGYCSEYDLDPCHDIAVIMVLSALRLGLTIPICCTNVFGWIAS